MSNETSPRITQGGTELPADNVGELGWQFIDKFPHKVRCRKCGRRRWRGVVSHTANVSDPEVPMICFPCYDDLDNGPRESVDH